MTAPHNIPRDLAQRLTDCIEVERGLRRCAFDMARILKRYVSDPAHVVDISEAVFGECDLPDCWEYEYLIEEIYSAFSKVRYAEGDDPFTAAVMWAQSQELPVLAGEWPPLQSITRDAAITLLICESLSRGNTAPFFLPCRKLAEVIPGGHDRAAKILRLLRENGYLTIAQKPTRHKGTYYRLKSDIGSHRIYVGSHRITQGTPNGVQPAPCCENIRDFPIRKEATQ